MYELIQSERTALPISFYDDIPLVPATLEGHPGIFAIDTGNSGSLVVQHVWADKVGLTDRQTHRPAELSGGQQQRVAVARALATRPAVIFADEPTGNLDSRSSGEILDLMRQSVDDYGQTLVMVTHDPRAAARADRIVALADGQIVHDAPVPEGGPDAVLDLMKEIGQ